VLLVSFACSRSCRQAVWVCISVGPVCIDGALSSRNASNGIAFSTGEIQMFHPDENRKRSKDRFESVTSFFAEPLSCQRCLR
jgi:hypothetical protein